MTGSVAFPKGNEMEQYERSRSLDRADWCMNRAQKHALRTRDLDLSKKRLRA